MKERKFFLNEWRRLWTVPSDDEIRKKKSAQYDVVPLSDSKQAKNVSQRGPLAPCMFSLEPQPLADLKPKKTKTTKQVGYPLDMVECECLLSGIITRCRTAPMLHGRGQLLRYWIFLTLVTCFSHDTNSSPTLQTSQNIYIYAREGD